MDNLQYIYIVCMIFIIAIVIYSFSFTKEGFENISVNNLTVNINMPLPIIYENFLTDDECEYFKSVAEPHMERSHVLSNNTPISDVRTSYQTFLDKTDPYVINLYNRISAIVGVPVENFESFQVARYYPSQEYKAHYDACDLVDKECVEDMKRGGLRLYTCLMYLSDEFTGGATDFPNLNVKVQPKKGMAVFFRNLNKDRTRPTEFFHAGMPVLSGTKYIANCWIRESEFK